MNNPASRVVYDCNIYIQALINLSGPSGRCIQVARSGQTTLFATSFVLEEIRESYKKIPPKYRVTQQQTEKLATEVAGFAILIAYVPSIFHYPRDPDDAHYVNLALAANANLIVSRDRDLLDLTDNSRPEAAAFHNRFPSLHILDPIQFLRQLDSQSNASNP